MNDKFIKFVFLTGVSKFNKTSIFSGLNNITDISLNAKYGNICGYTQNDIEAQFMPYLKNVDMNKLKLWYNGYNFLGDRVYNPFDILLFITNDHKYSSYWFETGTPTFLIKLLKKNSYFVPNFENLEADESLLNSFDIEEPSLETIMFQSGYLTIKKVMEEYGFITYTLGYPNNEVRLSFNRYIVKMFTKNSESVSKQRQLLNIFKTGNLDELEMVIHRLFASIAYNNFTNNEIQNYEGFYASVLYAYFASLGIEIIAEDVTNYGRIDLTLKFGGRVYIFEFKIIDEDPLKQIREKKYYEKYTSVTSTTGSMTTLSSQGAGESALPVPSKAEVFIIGIVFDPKERNVTGFVWEKI